MMDAFSAAGGNVAREKEQGYACGYATCTLEGNGQALSPSPQTRRAERVRWLA